MNLFAKYPWLQSMALCANGEPLVNGFRLSEILGYRARVNWPHLAELAFDEVRRELEARGILIAGAVIWRDGMVVSV